MEGKTNFNIIIIKVIKMIIPYTHFYICTTQATNSAN